MNLLLTFLCTGLVWLFFFGMIFFLGIHRSAFHGSPAFIISPPWNLSCTWAPLFECSIAPHTQHSQGRIPQLLSHWPAFLFMVLLSMETSLLLNLDQPWHTKPTPMLSSCYGCSRFTIHLPVITIIQLALGLQVWLELYFWIRKFGNLWSSFLLLGLQL